jgi:hypothetical protein
VVVTLPAGTETGLGTLTPAIGESSLVCIDRTAPGGLKSVTSAVTRPDAGKTSVAPAGSGVSAVTRPDAGRGSVS